MLHWLSENVGGPAMLVLVGTLITAAGAIWTARKQIQAANDRAGFEKALRERSDEIANLQRQIASSVTGGESFCFVLFIPDGASFRLLLTHQGQFPLYDITVRITDPDAVSKQNQSPKTPSELLDMTQTGVILIKEIGNLAPLQGFQIGQLPVPLNNTKRYEIQIMARNGLFAQTVILRNVNGVWKSAIRVERVELPSGVSKEPPKLPLEIIPEDFPRDNGGHIQWQ